MTLRDPGPFTLVADITKGPIPDVADNPSVVWQRVA